jgi:hypothetical protein
MVTRSEKGLSIKQLVKYFIPYNVVKSRDVVIKALSKKKTKSGGPAIVATCVDMTGAKRPHKCTVVGKDPSVLTLVGQEKVLISCDCEDFWATYEYALTQWGASQIKYCNGDPAVVKNPQNYPGCCKHLTRLIKEISVKKM